ncbi:hypothetical protein LOTGIDRAFT_227335 [Lottia gigantea]|uniref:Sulfotransferase domain-containing protein n=1 Tax=Lottia gigantea TaxID=225164 RepID=V4AM67_LOTGI|nr:hypothetical protein LOTGIDRAFT_227335 [Lottia gigantea]ESO94701.1 hypothetical protein LOTGIDRAFT_227335 [Lottia gigantea]
MALVKIPDSSGNTVVVRKLKDGRLMPKFDPEVLENVKSLKLREDDVIILAYPKSGTHWLFEIAQMLKLGTTDVPVVSKSDFMIEYVKQDILDAKPLPRILNTHYRFHDLPTDIHTKKPKILYIRRNPKDASVSFYNHTIKLSKYYEYSGQFSDYLRLWVEGVDYGSWFDYVKEYEEVCQNSDLDILSLEYEQLKKDLINEVRKISDFLELERNEELIKDISERCTFSSMHSRKGHLTGLADGQSIMYRKGDVGDWKNWFTVAENEWFDEVYKEKMKDSNLKFVYELK